jgi:flavin reductase (DIM6/NTAB) family NADH-FMN oxidoreductase RutF
MEFDFAQLSTQDQYKLVVSTIVPRPIAWVVTLDRNGRLNAAPFSFFNALGSDPPIVCVGVGPREPGTLKDTAAIIRTTGEFVVNLVNEATVEAMNVTAIEFGPEVDEIAEAGLTTLPSRRVRPPRIAESPVALECTRVATVELGNDRSIVMGRVLAMHVQDDCVLDAGKCYVDTPRLRLVARMHGRGWYARTSDLFELPRIAVKDWWARKRRAAE